MQPLIPPAQQLAEVDDLLRTMPPIASFESAGAEHYAWLGRASALVHRWDSVTAIARFDGFASQLGSGASGTFPKGPKGYSPCFTECVMTPFCEAPLHKA